MKGKEEKSKKEREREKERKRGNKKEKRKKERKREVAIFFLTDVVVDIRSKPVLPTTRNVSLSSPIYEKSLQIAIFFPF